MKTGICLNAYPCPIDEQFALIKKHGFEATFGDSLDARLPQIHELCEKYGIVMENYHAPFRGINNMWLDTPEGDKMLKQLTDSIDNCKKYGVDTLIVHLSSSDTPPRMCDIGFARFDKLMEYADANGVTIAFENQRKLANLAYVFEQYPTARVCWDTGHEACFAYGRQFMPLFSDKLVALHVHDNHCVHNGDEHMIPFDASIDFDRVTSQIADSPFDRSLMLELIASKHAPYLEMGADEYYKKASDVAKKLASEIERKRSLKQKG